MPAHRDAFSIIELLVAISIIAILIALSVPALAGARSAADRAKVLSNLRQLGHSVELYTGVHDGRYPILPADALYDTPEYARIGGGLMLHPFRLRYGWPYVMEGVAPWREHYTTWLNPDVQFRPGEPWIQDLPSGGYSWTLPSYIYSHAFMADPRLFRPGGFGDQGQTAHLLRAVRTSEVAYPSNKALMYDDHWLWAGRAAMTIPSGVLAADGAAAFRAAADATPPVEHPWRVSAAFIYADTPEGVHGRDW
ncbi:MAG: prepilin-type N-terminal cleavage/methylation domain-containing protein [Phycisphaerales bacterium]|nr:MAG: prepilin-type N-terminal cleavage/methylation domain-containing protein [Phycisphaerales bacterium]